MKYADYSLRNLTEVQKRIAEGYIAAQLTAPSRMQMQLLDDAELRHAVQVIMYDPVSRKNKAMRSDAIHAVFKITEHLRDMGIML